MTTEFLINLGLDTLQIETMAIVAAGAGVLNWSICGAVLLILLFMGSSWFGEYITKSKYPEYAEYIRKVNRYFPGRRYE